MSHNTSREKQRENARKRRLEELKPFLVPGWQVGVDLRLQAVETVLGFHQRGQSMLLRCRRADCRRRMELDFKDAVRAGYGDRPIAELLLMLRCCHWAGCRLEQVSATYSKGVPLIAFLDEDGVIIAVNCERCSSRLLLPPAAVITKLKQAGRGDGSTGVLELGAVVRGPCRKCGGRRFSSGLIRPKAAGT